MLRDYYGRIIGLPIDHPDNDAPQDDDDLTQCEFVTDCEDFLEIEAILSEEDDDTRMIAEFTPFIIGQS